MRRPLLLAAMAVAIASVGCGASGPSDEELVAGTVTSFGRATAAKDYDTLCAKLLAPSLVEKVEQIGLPCTKAMSTALGGVKDPQLTVGKVTIHGDRASAEIRTSAAGQSPSRDTLELERVKGTWRIASLGAAG